jgi:hypothetical protein
VSMIGEQGPWPKAFAEIGPNGRWVGVAG